MTDIFNEPPIDPVDDTHPTQTVPQVLLNNRSQQLPLWRRLFGLMSLLGAFILTAGTVILLVSTEGSTPDPTALPQQTQSVAIVPSDAPTDLPAPTDATQNTAQQPTPVPVIATLDPATIQSLLANPIQSVGNINGAQIQAIQFDPFTIIPDRPRNEVIVYEAVSGDTIYSISERFGLETESIAWSNDRRIVQVLRPGDLVNVPPVDGVLITTVGRTTIAEYASRYLIADPYAVIDSPYNPSLSGFAPEDVPPSGTQIFFAGGTGEEITWTPTVIREGDDGSGSGGNFISFAPGQAGSCGSVANPGGGGAWRRPVSGYQITQGYSGFHTGIDLSVAEGTPVHAANGGRVIFAGWNSFGYGYTVVLAHGPFTTLYGHLVNYNVSCGQDVAPGQQIALSGNSGNSSGPHLHFEIRYLDSPQDPAFTIGF